MVKVSLLLENDEISKLESQNRYLRERVKDLDTRLTDFHCRFKPISDYIFAYEELRLLSGESPDATLRDVHITNQVMEFALWLRETEFPAAPRPEKP